MRMLKLAIPAGIVAAGFLFCTTASYGKAEYMKKENLKACTTCHVKVAAPDAMKKDPNLTEIGKCYSANDHSLAKCTVPADAKKQ
jgi:cytochrome c553